MKLEMKQMEYLKLLEEKIDKNSKKLNAIYEILTKVNKPIEDSNKIKPNPDYTTKKPKLYPKNVNLLQKILKVNTNTNTEAFLTSILNNNYPTITQGQQDVIVQLANQYNLSNDDY